MMPSLSEQASERATIASVLHARLAVIDLQGRGDGIAYAARLLHAGLTRIAGAPPRVLAVNPRTPREVSLAERARYAARLAMGQAGRDYFWIFSHLGIARPMAAIPAALRRPYAVMLNGIEAWDPKLDQSRLTCLRNATARIAISHHTAQRVAETHPDIGSVMACPLALLPDEHSTGELVHPAHPCDEHTVVIVGRMSADERYKGHDQLLECWPAVLGQVPQARLLMIGGGDDRDRLRAKAAELGIAADRVCFPGYVPDAALEGFLARAGIFAMPSRGEGFGLVYLNAMRAGLPCVGSIADAAGDIISDGATGFLVEQSDVGGLATILVRLLKSPGLRQTMGAAGRARFEAEFTFDRYVARLSPILAEAFPLRSH